jgi:hypothetical protein
MKKVKNFPKLNKNGKLITIHRNNSHENLKNNQ